MHMLVKKLPIKRNITKVHKLPGKNNQKLVMILSEEKPAISYYKKKLRTIRISSNGTIFVPFDLNNHWD